MSGCNGNCGGCSGCARELVLSREEIGLLEKLGIYAFLPVARMPAEERPVCFEQEQDWAGLLVLLEKKGLVSLDYDLPLAGFEGYGNYPIRGSAALTERGQKVLELLEYQGFQEE